MCEYRRYPTVRINLKKPLLKNKRLMCFQHLPTELCFSLMIPALSDLAFVNVKNGATCQLQVKALLAQVVGLRFASIH